MEVKGAWQAVDHIQDHWQLVDLWWRAEERRHYYRIAVASGQVLTVFRNPLEDAWYLQPYDAPRRVR